MLSFRAALLCSGAPGGGGLSYPYALTMTNPDAETGDTTGWTHTFGAGIGVQTTSPHSGTYRFVLSTSDEYAEVKADAVDIPGAYESAVDAGTVSLDFDIWRTDFTDGDYGRARIEFFSGAGGTGTFLGCRTGNFWFDENGTWIQSSHSWRLPPLTRSIVLHIFGRRSAGTELSFYWDDVELSLTSNTGCDRVYSMRAADTSGWTVLTGSGQPGSSTSWNDYTWPGINGGSQVAYVAYKDVAVSALSAAAQAAIAAGTATLRLHRYASNTNQDDKSRTRGICRAGGSAVATVEDAAATTNWSGAYPNILQDGTVAIPNTTDTIRIQHDFDRVDGTVLDACVGFVYLWVSW